MATDPAGQSFTVPPEYDGRTLWQFLRGCCRMSAALIRSTKFLPDGFTIAGRQARTDRIVRAGETVTARFRPDSLALPRLDRELTVLYESESAVVFDKPAGLVVHPTLGYPDGTVANAFAAWCDRRGVVCEFRPVYRLDKNTSGCLLVARTRYAAGLLNGHVRKQYLALTVGVPDPPAGLLTGPIGFEDGSFIRHCVRPDGKPSTTEYRVDRVYGGYAAVAVRPVTGRTHQIRVHMAHLGYPLLGDDLYGGPCDRIARQALHCRRICFEDGGGPGTVESPVPPDMAALL